MTSRKNFHHANVLQARWFRRQGWRMDRQILVRRLRTFVTRKKHHTFLLSSSNLPMDHPQDVRRMRIILPSRHLWVTRLLAVHRITIGWPGLTRAVKLSNLQNPFVKLLKVSMVPVVVINPRRLHQTVSLRLRLRAMLQVQVIVVIRDIRHHMVKVHLHHHFWRPTVILETSTTLVTPTATKTPRLLHLIRMSCMVRVKCSHRLSLLPLR